MKNIIISGINGKMGQCVYAAAADEGLSVICGVDKKTSANTICPVYSSFKDVKEKADVVIDFSSPTILDELLSFCLKTKTALVIATTGLSGNDEQKIIEASKEIPVFKTSNTSLAMNVLIYAAEQIAEKLTDYDIEIIERHHRLKKDSPSGTAETIINELKKTRENYSVVYGRHSLSPRKANEIGVHSVRGGGVAGEHEVCFYGDYDTLKIVHTAQDKRLFAKGAVEAAKFIVNKNAGLYGMKDLKK